MSWIPRNIVDQNVQYPNRFQLKNVDTGEVSIFDITKTQSNGDILGTNINKDYLQPIEDYLGQVDDFQSRCVLQIETIQNTVSTLAPKNNPVLVNPTANPAAVSLNNARITTTADVKSYLDSLFSAYKG